MKLKTAAQNEVFPWEMGQELAAEITHLEDRMHQIMVGDVKYVFEIGKFIFIDNNKILLEGFLTDGQNTGRMAFEVSYGNQ
jgi:hypothetical protein